MNNLVDSITSYSGWENPWNFKQCVLQSPKLSEAEAEMFIGAWEVASDSELWRFNDIVLGCKSAQNALRLSFPELSDIAAGAIVRAVSYEWR
jgi:hypothetical protein